MPTYLRDVSDPHAMFQAALEEAADDVNEALDALLPHAEGPEAPLFEAMRYAVLSGGKRLRPFFVIQCGRLFDLERDGLLRAAAAVEIIHTYSLIHDDLPCMDDDDTRRGQPTVHRQFDEATAVLAGDALQALAFEILADPDTHADPRVRAELVRRLAKAAGGRGMVGGQMIDLVTEGENPPHAVITRMQRMKTGALIQFASEAGAIMARVTGDAQHALQGFSHDLGLSYQIVDDLLDVEGDADELGKAAQKDAARGKASFVAAMGPDAARDQARLLAAQAQRHLEHFGSRASLLTAAVDFVVERRL